MTESRASSGGWVQRQVVAFVAALQFLTLVPPLITRLFTSEEMGRAVAYFPVVGLALGALLAGLDALLGRIWPSGVSAALLLAAWIVMTGALHLDGFLDTCDGLLGGHDEESRLRIMRDERVGAFALAGGVLLLLLKYAALAALPSRAVPLLVALLLGRGAMAAAVICFPYARPRGVGRTLKDYARPAQVAAMGVLVLLGLVWGLGWSGLASLLVAALVTWGVARYTLARLPGLTGDLYGATCELTELGVLLLWVAVGGR